MIRSAILLFAFATAASGASLRIAQFAVQQYEDGQPVLKPESFSPGEQVTFSFFAEGYARKGVEVSVSYEAGVVDASGVPLCPPLSGKIETTLTDQDKDWVPKLRGNFVLPALLLPGTFTLSVHAKDEISGAADSKDLTFLVSGPKIDPSPVLAVRNLDFYRNDEDERPLEVAAYRVSEEIHARFAIIGFRHDKSAIDVTYGVALADSTGKILFQDPAAARDTAAEFYPKPYVPGAMSFTLKPGTAPGEYTLTVTARDAIGNQQTGAHRSFRLE